MKFAEFRERRFFARTQVVPLLEKAGFAEKANKIKFCGHFKKIAECNDCGTWHFNGSDSCKDRFCPLCQKKRSLLWFAKITPLLREYLQKDYYVNMLNFTIRDTENLDYGINLINNAFRYLMHDNKKTAREFNKRFIGGVRSLEVKRGKNSGLWHPHFHCLVVKYEYSKDFEWLKREWNNALCVVSGRYGEKLGSVDIRGFTKDQNKGLETAICECFKYMTKFNWAVKDIPELILTMDNRKTLVTWGCVRFKLGNSVEEDLDKPLSEIKSCVCSVCGCDSFTLIDNVGLDYLSLADLRDTEQEYKIYEEKQC